MANQRSTKKEYLGGYVSTDLARRFREALRSRRRDNSELTKTDLLVEYCEQGLAEEATRRALNSAPANPVAAVDNIVSDAVAATRNQRKQPHAK